MSKRKPTILKILAGNPGKHKLNKNEPKFPKNMPRPPRCLSYVAMREWNFLGPILYAQGLLTEGDGAAFAAYCSAYATWYQAEAEMKKPGFRPLMRGNACEIASPWYGIRNKALVLMKSYLLEFGLSPSSRGKLTAAAPQKEDDLNEFLKEKQQA